MRELTISKRLYEREVDYDKVYQLLVETYQEGKFINWLPSRWEYMHYHPYYKDELTSKSALWEEDGKLVAAVHNELGEGDAFFTFRPTYEYLFEEMLEHAEKHLAKDEEGKRKLTIHANDFNGELIEILKQKGYTRAEEHLQHFTICTFDMEQEFPQIKLPEGYSVISLADDNDFKKIDRVLWRGFGHDGEPAEGGVEDRELMQSAPNFRKDLNMVTVAPNGDFVSYAGFFLQEDIKVGYVEPVATDPEYRRLGLGTAAMLEGIKRCIESGANTVIVESSQPFYLSMGFQPQFIRHPWYKSF